MLSSRKPSPPQLPLSNCRIPRPLPPLCPSAPSSSRSSHQPKLRASIPPRPQAAPKTPAAPTRAKACPPHLSATPGNTRAAPALRDNLTNRLLLPGPSPSTGLLPAAPPLELLPTRAALLGLCSPVLQPLPRAQPPAARPPAPR